MLRKAFMGECGKETSFEILDYFYESGGNFIDTSNNYVRITCPLTSLSNPLRLPRFISSTPNTSHTSSFSSTYYRCKS